MLTVSDAFKTQLDNDKRLYLYKIDINLANGDILLIENEDLWSGSVKFTQATSGNGNFDVGAFIIGKMNFIINDMYGRFGDTYDFNLATVDLQIGLDLPGGNTEYVRIGRYVVDEVDYDGYLIAFECLDYAYYFEQPWATTLNFPTTAGAVIQEACTKCGITLATSSWDGYNIAISTKPTDKNMTWLAAIGYAAQICGQYAKMDHLGRLTVKWYDVDNLQQVSIDGTILDSTDARILDHVDDPIVGSMVGASEIAWNELSSEQKARYARINQISHVKVGHYPILITGVKCTVNTGETDTEYSAGTSEYMVDVTGNPFIGTGNVNTVVTRIAENVVGHYFYTFDVSYLSRPYYEAGDLAWIEDYLNGRVYCSFITNMSFTAGQYQDSSCGAETPAKKQTASYTPAMKIIAEAGRSVRDSLDSYESISKSMTELISLGYGMYFTAEEQQDGSSIFYLHDKATIGQSTNVWKVTSTGLVVSHDHGTTWAVDEMGNALYNVLTARGINADWINSGKITIRDQGGNTTFEADTATGAVRINATSFSLTGRSINDVVQDTVNGMDLNNVVMELDNGYQLIPTDADGNYTAFPQCSSTAKIFYGASDVTASAAFATPTVSGVIGTWNASTKTYTVTGMTADSGTVTFTAIYGSATLSKQFTVVKSKQGRDGADGTSVNILGSYNTVAELQAAHPTGSVGDAYIVSGDLYVWADNAWTNVGQIQGPAGQNGTNGTNGSSAYVHFAYSTSSDGQENFSVTPFSGAVYIGVRSDNVVQDSTVYTDYSWSKMKGDDGRGVSSIIEYYGISNSTNTQPTSWSTSVVNPTASNRYLWNYNVTAYTSGNPTSTTPRVIGMYSENGANGRGISSITEYYQVSSSSTTSPSTWSTAVVNTTTTNKYLWNYEETTYTDGTTSSSTPRIIGTHGSTGASARTYLLEVSPKSTKLTQANTYSPKQVTIRSYYRDGAGTSKTAYSATYKVDVCVGSTWYENIATKSSASYSLLELRYDAQASTPYENEDAPGIEDTWDICVYLVSGASSVRIRMLSGSTLLDQEEISLLSDATAVTLDQESVFNALTNGGQDQGIFLNSTDHKIYINSSYIATGNLVVGGYSNSNGTIRVNDANGNLVGGVNNTEIYHKTTSNDKISMRSAGLYFYKNTSTEIGHIERGSGDSDNPNALAIHSVYGTTMSSNGTITIRCEDGNTVYDGLTISKSSSNPVQVSNGATEYYVEIPTSINSDGTVASWANLRIVGGIVYGR